MRNVYILGRTGAHANEKIPVQDELIIGRDHKMCQLVYPESEKNISGVHCKIQEINGNICLIDLDSTNGTFFQDGTRLKPSMPRTMRSGQGFYLGSRENSFDLLVEEIEEPKRGIDILGVVLCIFALVMIIAGLLFSWIFIGIGIVLGVVGIQRIRTAGRLPAGASGAGDGNKVLTIALIIVLVLVIVVLAYAYYQATHKSDLEKLMDAGGVLYKWFLH